MQVVNLYFESLPLFFDKFYPSLLPYYFLIESIRSVLCDNNGVPLWRMAAGWPKGSDGCAPHAGDNLPEELKEGRARWQVSGHVSSADFAYLVQALLDLRDVVSELEIGEGGDGCRPLTMCRANITELGSAADGKYYLDWARRVQGEQEKLLFDHRYKLAVLSYSFSFYSVSFVAMRLCFLLFES